MSVSPDQSEAGSISARGHTRGERKVISVLFTDVVNYTSLAEQLDLEAVRAIIDGHFKALIEVVTRYQGTVDQFLGDGMVAFFGAPVAHEDHAQRACHAALAMQVATHKYAETIRKDHGIEFQVRIGVNSGPVLVGPIGNAQHTEYIAIGDTVNLASRMENASRPGGVLVSENTYSLTRDFFQFEPVGEIGVKGKDKPVSAHRLIQAMKTESRFDAAVAKGLTPFVGREREIEILRHALTEARNGHSQTVGIKGEPGIGKSRLLREFRKGVRSDDVNYLEGRCLHYGSSMPFRPLVDIVKAYFDIREADTEADAKQRIEKKLKELDESLLSYMPFLYEALSLEVEDERFARMENQYKRSKLFEGIMRLLLKEASIRPLVVAVEDLHWIDKASEEFLAYLMTGFSDSRILLLLLYRPEYLSPWTGGSNGVEIRLSQLSTPTSSELLRALLADGEPASELRDLVLAKTGGNPLFTEEYVHTMLDSGSIQKDGNLYTLNKLASTVKLPDTVQGIIAARIDRLPQGLKDTLQLASVMGRDFNYAVLQDVMELPEELKSQLDTLQQLEFINRMSETDCVFKHALIQQVAYESLLQMRRRELHESIALAIERLHPERLDELVEVLAYHYHQSHSQDKAVEYLRKSGRKALSRYATEASHQNYQQAFDIISAKNDRTRVDQSVLFDVLLEWAEVHYYRGHFRALHGILTNHSDVADSLGDKSRQAMLLGWSGICQFAAAQTRESYHSLHQALVLAEESADARTIARVCAWLSWACCTYGLLDEGLAYAEKGISTSRLVEGDDYPYIKALGGKGFCLSAGGKQQEALECSRRLLRFGEERGNLRSLAMGSWLAAFCHFNSGETSLALDDCQKGLALKADPFYHEVMRHMFGVVSIFGGRFQEAETLLRQVVDNGRRFGIEKLERMASAMLGIIEASKGEMKRGFRMMTEADRDLLARDAKHDRTVTQYLLGTLYAQIAAPTAPVKVSLLVRNIGFLLRHAPFATRKAIAHYNECAAICRDGGFDTMLGMAHLELGRLYKNKGKKDLARENLVAAIALCKECDATGNLKQAEELLASLNER